MRLLFGSAFCCLLVLALVSVPSARTTFVSFTIDDTHLSGGGAGVFSDAAVTSPELYRHFAIDENDMLNWCVDAEPAPPGNLFVRLNRKLDGDAGVLRCTDNLRPDGELGVQRNFVLRINNAEACEIASDPLAGMPVMDANGASWTTGGLLPCTIAHNDSPRIRLGTLYKAKSKGTNIDFLTVMFGYPNSYEIRSDGTASITSAAYHKHVSYSGTFRFVKFEPGKKARAVGPSFAMPLVMDFYEQ